MERFAESWEIGDEAGKEEVNSEAVENGGSHEKVGVG